MKYQVLSFGLMIGLTIVAFLTVATDGVGSWFTIPFIILLIDMPSAFFIDHVYPTIPIKYTTVKMKTHTTSIKCQ